VREKLNSEIFYFYTMNNKQENHRPKGAVVSCFQKPRLDSSCQLELLEKTDN
jgi:hypothetical protein